MSYQFSKAELESMNLTIWVNSGRVTFGKFDYDRESMSHTVSHSNVVRFHKPPQNRRDPVDFVIQSVAKLIDGVRGPLSVPGTPLTQIPEPAVNDIRSALKTLRDNPSALLNEVLIETPWLTVKQPLHSVLVCEVKGYDICYALAGMFDYLDGIHAHIDRTLMGKVSKEYSQKVKRYMEEALSELKGNRVTDSKVLFEDDILRLALRTVKPAAEKVVSAVGRLSAETPEGESFHCEVFDEGPNLNQDVIEFLNTVRSRVLQHRLEDFIANTLDLKLGKYPTETKTLFKSNYITLDFIKY